jgi:hypothetical protein
MQEGKLACASFPPWWDDVVRDEIMLMQEGKLAQGKLAHASFPPWWDDIV